MNELLKNMNDFENSIHVKGKLFGIERVNKKEGKRVCEDAMIGLKALLLVKKEHKQKLNIFIHLDGIEIKDEDMNRLYKHSFNQISYISLEQTDPKAIGYIFMNDHNEYQYFGFRTNKQARGLFNLIKDLLINNSKYKYLADPVSKFQMRITLFS